MEVVSSKLDAPQNQPQMHLALHLSGETIGRFGLDSSALPCQQHFFRIQTSTPGLESDKTKMWRRLLEDSQHGSHKPVDGELINGPTGRKFEFRSKTSKLQG